MIAGILFVPYSFGNDFASRLCDMQKAMGVNEPLICKIKLGPDSEKKPPSLIAQLLQEQFTESQRQEQQLSQSFQCRLATFSNQDNSAADGELSRWEEEVVNADGAVVVLFSQDNCPGCKAIANRLYDICRGERRKTVNTLLRLVNIIGISDAETISAISETTCRTFPVLCDLINAFSPKFSNVKFAIVENDYKKDQGLFYDLSILYTPTLIMYYKGQKILRVTGANVDCFEMTARIAEAWHVQDRASHQITSALGGRSTCAISPDTTGRCTIDRECYRKLKKLLQQFTSYASASPSLPLLHFP